VLFYNITGFRPEFYTIKAQVTSWRIWKIFNVQMEDAPPLFFFHQSPRASGIDWVKSLISTYLLFLVLHPILLPTFFSNTYFLLATKKEIPSRMGALTSRLSPPLVPRFSFQSHSDRFLKLISTFLLIPLFPFLPLVPSFPPIFIEKNHFFIPRSCPPLPLFSYCRIALRIPPFIFLFSRFSSFSATLLREFPNRWIFFACLSFPLSPFFAPFPVTIRYRTPPVSQYTHLYTQAD